MYCDIIHFVMNPIQEEYEFYLLIVQEFALEHLSQVHRLVLILIFAYLHCDPFT